MGEREYNNGRKNSPCSGSQSKNWPQLRQVTQSQVLAVTHGILYLARSTLVYGIVEN